MMGATAFTNARLLDPATQMDQPGKLLAVDGVIVDFGPNLILPDQADVIDCRGHALMPGLIDMACFNADARAAAAGGVTTLVQMPDQRPIIDHPAAVDHASGQSDWGPHILTYGAATKGLLGQEMAELGLMADAGAVGFTDARQAVQDSRLMRRLLDYAGIGDFLILQHAEDPSLAQDGVMNEGETATRLGLPGRPGQAEAMMIDRDAHLMRLTGGRLHCLHLSSQAGLTAVAKAKADGLRLTCGTQPAYFMLNETAVGEFRTFAKLCPPLRTEDDRVAVRKAIHTGLIDVICSAHDPRDVEDKRQPFSEAAFGMVGLETMLPLALMLYHNDEIGLLDLLKTMTSRPAEILGLAAGRLAKGAPADLALVDLDQPWSIDPDRFHSTTRNTPFEGVPVQGRVKRTIVAGETIYQDKD